MATRLKVKINNFTDFSEREKAKLFKATEFLEVIVNSSEFKEKFINHTYNGKKTFVQNEGLSNEQIFEKIMAGAEVLLPEVDNEIDVDITIYNAGFTGRNVVGFTYPNVVKTWINRKFFSFYSDEEVAANIFHEWLHKLGFGHDYNRTARRNFSVPYAGGNIVKLVGKILKGKPVPPNPAPSTNPTVYRPTIWQRVRNFFRRLF